CYFLSYHVVHRHSASFPTRRSSDLFDDVPMLIGPGGCLVFCEDDTRVGCGYRDVVAQSQAPSNNIKSGYVCINLQVGGFMTNLHMFDSACAFSLPVISTLCVPILALIARFLSVAL